MLINELRRQRTSQTRLDGQVCIITGANSGVGLAAARRYAQGGARVVMVCRDPARGQAAQQEISAVASEPVELHLADLSLMRETRRVSAELLERYPTIQVLINNAGLHSERRIFTEEGHETCFAVNHLAPFLMTRLLLPRLRKIAPARILNVSSQGHRFCGVDLNDLDWQRRRYRGLKSYGQSKTANLFFTWELAEQLKGSGVTVNAVHPGSVKSRIGSNNGPAWRAMHAMVSLALRNPALAGESLYYMGAAPELADVSGRFFNLTLEERPHPHARHNGQRQLARNTWLLSEQLTGLVQPTV